MALRPFPIEEKELTRLITAVKAHDFSQENLKAIHTLSIALQDKWRSTFDLETIEFEFIVLVARHCALELSQIKAGQKSLRAVR